MLDEKGKRIRELHLNYLARLAVHSALSKHGPLTLDALAVVLHWDYSYTVDIIAQLRERNEVGVAGTLKLGETGRPVNVYGLRSLHVPEPTTRDKLYALLCDKGDSPCLELSRRRQHFVKFSVAGDLPGLIDHKRKWNSPHGESTEQDAPRRCAPCLRRGVVAYRVFSSMPAKHLTQRVGVRG